MEILLHDTASLVEETSRLAALKSYDILDSLPEQDYSDVARLAAEICQTPFALVGLIDAEREWFKATYGLDVAQIPRADSLFSPAEALLADSRLIPDARTDSRFASNPWVTAAPHIVFYAGVPLVDANGFVLGELAVLDSAPRPFNDQQMASLRRLANQVVRLLDLRKKTKLLAESEERYRLEKAALEISRKRFETIFDHAPIGLGLLRGPDHVFERVNDRIAQMAGRPAEQMRGRPLLEAIPELAGQGLNEILDSVRQTGQRFVVPALPVTRRRNNQQETAYFQTCFEPVQEPDGSVSIVTFSVEITGHTRSLRNLLDSEAGYRNLVEQSPMAIGHLKGRDMVIELGNARIFEVWGKDPSITGMRLIDALPELKGQPFMGLLEEVYDTGKPFYGDSILARLTRNGRLEDVYFDFSYTPLRNTDNQITGIMVLAVEVTDQVLARRAIEKSEARFRGLIDEAPFAIAVYETADLVISVANEAMIKLWGKTPAVVGRKLADALPELEGQPFIPLLNNVYTTGQAYRTTEQQAYLMVDGQLQGNWFNFVYQPLTDAEGRVYAILNMAVDVTERVRARRQLEEAQEALRGAVELAELGTWEWNTQRDVITFSERIQGWFEDDKDRIATNRMHEQIHEDDRARVLEAMQRATTPGGDGLLDEIYRIITRQTNQERTMHVQAKAYFDQQGHPLKMVGNMRDITEQHQQQQALEQKVQERTHALELANQDLQRSNANLQQFAYVASHDLQEPLRKIHAFSTLLKEQFDDQLNEAAEDYLNRITNASSRMSTLIKDLLSYSRIATRQQAFGPISLDEVLTGVLDNLWVQIEQRQAQVLIDKLPVVNGDESQLSQLFQNLLSNAIKFTPNDQVPQIEVRYARRQLSELPPEVRPSRSTQFYHQISVSDSGVGFDIKYLDRIFQVFQRLHGRNEFPGTGVGLAICQRVVENHGGGITASSKPGEGATFSVYLPG